MTSTTVRITGRTVLIDRDASAKGLGDSRPSAKARRMCGAIAGAALRSVLLPWRGAGSSKREPISRGMSMQKAQLPPVGARTAIAGVLSLSSEVTRASDGHTPSWAGSTAMCPSLPTHNTIPWAVGIPARRHATAESNAKHLLVLTLFIAVSPKNER